MLEREQVTRKQLHPQRLGKEQTGSKAGQCRGWWHQPLVFQKRLLVPTPPHTPAGSRAGSQPRLSSTPARHGRACKSALLDAFLKTNTGPLLHLPWSFSRTSREAAPAGSPASETLSSHAFQRVAIWLLYKKPQPS